MNELALRTQSDVFKLPVPPKGEAVYFDQGKPSDRVTGLALRIRAAGSRKFVFFYRNGARQLKKLTIGESPALTLDAARKKARAFRVQIDNQEDPAVAKATKREESALLFQTVKDEYLASPKCKKMKPRSLEESKRHLDKHWKPFHGLSLGSINRSLIAVRLRKINADSGPVAADRARSTLSAMFAWAMGDGLLSEGAMNPVTGTNKASDATPRERILSDAELAAVWNAAPENSYGKIVKLLMLTAQRRDEIGSLRWSEIEDGPNAMISLPSSRTKNSRPHEVPLSLAALNVLGPMPGEDERDLVFGEGEGGYSGWSRSKAALDTKLGKVFKPWTLHDLRRTAATRMADLGVPPHVIEAVLNHVSGHKAGVAGIYNRSTYAVEKRAALDLWANHVMVAVAQTKGANVVRIKHLS